MREAQGPRDELELSLTEALSPVLRHQVDHLRLARSEAAPHRASRLGGDGARLHPRAGEGRERGQDSAGADGAEIRGPQRPGHDPRGIRGDGHQGRHRTRRRRARRSKIEITQTLDTRQFLINGALPLEIKATASGLVPELEQLLDLEPLKKAIGVKNINPHDGLQVKEINTWGDQVAPRSERLWTISLDGDPIRAADGPTEFQFPAAASRRTPPRLPDLQRHESRHAAAAGRCSSAATRRDWGTGRPDPKPHLYGLGWRRLALVVLSRRRTLRLALKRRSGKDERPLRARDVFNMPREVDGFAVVALLRRLRTSPLVNLQEPQQQELQQDLQRVQQACFGAGGGAMSEADLRGVAEKWLRLAC